MISRNSLKRITPLYAAYRRTRALRAWLGLQARLMVATAGDMAAGRTRGSRPLPPAKLRYRVSGSLDPVSFQRTGQVIAADLRRILGGLGLPLDSFERVLDFGCGCGRVMAELADGAPAGRFHGTDIDPELVDWCRRHIPDVTWATNAHQPPLDWPDATFDLVYAVSVFTHLDEPMQDRWLAELRRIAKPGAVLILTTLGSASISQLGAARRSIIEASGFGFFTGATGRLKLDALPDFYQIAYHAPEYVARHWSRWFEVVCHLERAINDHQDAVVLRLPGDG